MILEMAKHICSIVLTILLVIQCSKTDAAELSPSKSLVWGPGLTSGYVVPARFFYVQPVDTDGNNITESLGKDSFKVLMFNEKGTAIRVYQQILERQDGSYIVRFKLLSSFKKMTILVRHQAREMGDSPFHLDDPVYHEQCNCPVPEISDWYTNMQCQPSYRQIKLDLSHWEDPIDMDFVAKEAITRFSRRGQHSLCHYVVKDNQIYRKTYGEHVGFKMFMDAILLSLTRKVKLPDLEFFANLGDWPLEKKSKDSLPIFSWCGSDETRDIIMPTYDLTESTLQTMGRVTLDLQSVQGNTGPAWADKSDVAFWRGRDSRQERLDLVRLSKRQPDKVDARLTNMFFFEKKEDLLPLVKHVSFFDFFKSKYQLNIDGTVAAYRFPYLMAGDSLILKQDSPYYEHFYKLLKPYEHYLPVKRDLSDLLDQLEWAKEHQEEARQMAKNSREFVLKHLTAGEIFCYHTRLFESYAKKLKNPVKVREGMELVEQPTDRFTECDCHRDTKFTKDEL